MDLVEFGGVCEVGVFRCVVVIPMSFSSEAEYIYKIEKGVGLVDVFFFYLFEVRKKSKILRVKTVNLMKDIDSSRVGFS